MKRHLLLPVFLWLSACSNLPPAIQDAPLYDLSYREAMQSLKNHANAPVRWGGIIVDIANEPTRSLLQVLYYPLNSYGRPLTDEPYDGRFVITSPDFLDPAVYAKNTEITVAGTLLGDIERTIDKKTLRLPLVSAGTMHLWPEYYPNNSVYGGFGYGGFGYYGPYHRFYGYYPYYWGGYWPYPYYWRR